MNRYNVALVLLALAVGPLFLISGWLSMLAVIAIYWLLARLANRDLDRKRGHSGRLHTVILSEGNSRSGKARPTWDTPR